MIKLFPAFRKSNRYTLKWHARCRYCAVLTSDCVSDSTSLPPVPAAVTDVRVSNNGRTDFLTVSWNQAAGEVDSYLVTLSDRDRTLHTLAVSKFNPGCIFNSLVSGRLYNISITSCSGRYRNHTYIQERTREQFFSESEFWVFFSMQVWILSGFWSVSIKVSCCLDLVLAWF